MFKNLRIRNFRAFDDLEISNLGRINLVTGKNNSGKTSLLEALFLLCGAGNPHMALNINAFRGIDSAQGSAVTVAETLWKPIFTNFDMMRNVIIEGRFASHGLISLNIAVERLSRIELPLDSPEGTIKTEFSNDSALKFSFKKGLRKKKSSNKDMEGRIRLTNNGLQVDPPASSPSYQAIFLSSRVGNLREDAQRLGQLRKRKQGNLIVKALQTVEPRLQNLEDNFASGVPMIWGDLGLSELVPLPMMGEGMTRIARLILAISHAQGGVVLVDEVENGLHHSALSNVWGAIDEAAKQFNTQVVASTHSYECMEAAYQSLDAEDFLVHRLESIDGAIRCVTLGTEEIEATIKHNLEMR